MIASFIKRTMHPLRRSVHLAAVLVMTLGLATWALTGCHQSIDADEPPMRDPNRIAVSHDGDTITISQDSPGLKQVSAVVANVGTCVIPVVAPARVVASILSGGMQEGRVLLFESADVTALYSQYRQSKANVDRATKNLARVRDMYTNQAATAKDLTEAETDAATARASMAEFENKLRGLGLAPAELGTATPGTVWLISDVTEEQLHEVQKGERVNIAFQAFPGAPVSGRAEAIGDVVDPATRTVKVRITAPNPKGRILPGMFARVDFGDPTSGVVPLPASAVVTVEGKDYVFVESSPGEFQRRRVLLVSSDANRVIVGKGLDNGERVVTSGAMLLKGLSFGY